MTSLHTASGIKMVEMRVEKLYPSLDLSSIIPPRSKDGVTEEEAALIQEEAPTKPEIIQVKDATPEQKNNDEAQSVYFAFFL